MELALLLLDCLLAWHHDNHFSTYAKFAPITCPGTISNTRMFQGWHFTKKIISALLSNFNRFGINCFCLVYADHLGHMFSHDIDSRVMALLPLIFFFHVSTARLGQYRSCMYQTSCWLNLCQSQPDWYNLYNIV